MTARWKVHGQREIYRSNWVDVLLDDVELPGGQRIDHHHLRMSRGSVTAVVVNGHDEALLLWRHRYITDQWGWEVPAGWIDAGEDPETAVRREILEETGWRATDIEAMTAYNALSGLAEMRFTAFVASGVERLGDPPDTTESERVEWVPLADVPKLAADGQLQDGPSLQALSFYLGMWRR